MKMPEHQAIIKDLQKTLDLAKWYQIAELFQINERLK